MWEGANFPVCPHKSKIWELEDDSIVTVDAVPFQCTEVVFQSSLRVEKTSNSRRLPTREDPAKVPRGKSANGATRRLSSPLTFGDSELASLQLTGSHPVPPAGPCAGEEHRGGQGRNPRNAGVLVSRWVASAGVRASSHQPCTSSLAHRRSGGIRSGACAFGVVLALLIHLVW